MAGGCLSGRGRLSGNQLKLIAALSMLLDHAGVVLFPNMIGLRILGRIALPIYAFMIAEGCRYTRNKLRYFSSTFFLGVGCQIFYYLFSSSTYLCILITFSLSILVIYAIQYSVQVLTGGASILRKIFAAALPASAIAAVYLLNRYFEIDYGFWGSMLPVLVSLCQPVKRSTSCGSLAAQVFLLGIGLCILAVESANIQWYSLASLPLILCYSGNRGKHNLKALFYLFYPLHLVLLQGVSLLLQAFS